MRFIISIVLATLAIWFVGVNSLDPIPTYFRETIILLAVTTVGLYFFMVRIKETMPQSFVIVYLATLVIKLLAFGTYIFVVVIDNPIGAVANAIFFMTTYLVYTVLEVVFLYFKVSPKGS